MMTVDCVVEKCMDLFHKWVQLITVIHFSTILAEKSLRNTAKLEDTTFSWVETQLVSAGSSHQELVERKHAEACDPAEEDPL